MLSYSIASARESDGAKNIIIMNGNSGYIGESNVYLKYLDDGYISIKGFNSETINGWCKLLSTFEIEPGNYTLTGIKTERETVALQLHIFNDTGIDRYLFQNDQDVGFIVEETAVATLQVRVYPLIENLDLIARPAVYKDE